MNLLHELDSNALNTKIHHVCCECGIAANVLTCLKRYGAPPKQLAFEVSTYRKGKCDFCHETKEVTETRDFFYPDFSLVSDYPKRLLAAEKLAEAVEAIDEQRTFVGFEMKTGDWREQRDAALAAYREALK